MYSIFLNNKVFHQIVDMIFSCGCVMYLLTLVIILLLFLLYTLLVYLPNS